MVALPLWLAPGVIVTVRLAPVPCKLIAALGTKVKLDDVAVTANKLTAVSASPIVNAIALVGVLSGVDCGPMALMVGGLFPITVNTKLLDAVLTPSLTVIVIVVVPVSPAVGVIVTFRLPPLPPNSMFAFATNVAFDEVADSVKEPAGVSVSATVNAIAAVGVPSAVD